jgi:hypothetical protein
MPRFQFLMLRAVEDGASLAEATHRALEWGAQHPDVDLFECRAYAEWEAALDDEDGHAAGRQADSAAAHGV